MTSPGTGVPTPIAGRALLLSNDSTAVGQLTNGMQQFAISADVCSDLATAARLINTRKFEVIVVDLGLTKQIANVLERIRLSPANQNSVTFALVESRAPEESQVQPNFIMHKPLTDGLVGSTLKVALGLIIRDYRRYYRCALKVPAILEIEGRTEVPCETVNVSEGGLAVTTPVILKSGAVVSARFTLPEEPTEFDIRAQVCWCHNNGRTGLHFLSVSPEQKLVLQLWLSHRIEQGLPEHIAELFQRAH
jgi:PilZ domain